MIQLCFLSAFLIFTFGVCDGETCQTFNPGRENFVLDTVDSIKAGAVFLSDPDVSNGDACITACCKEPKCNLALVEQGIEKESVNSCFLFNCIYKKQYVCKFIHKQGFKNYILESVYKEYLSGSKSVEKDKPPIANAGRDVVVQPNKEVLLNGIESWDDKKIMTYEWSYIGEEKSFFTMEPTDLPDQTRLSALTPGVYKFELTVTDSAHQSDSDQVTVLVLTTEQSQHHCLTPKKMGPCRGSFPRWHYNAASRDCENFFFGGCKENNNNYLSKQECLNACENTTAPGVPRKAFTEECNTSCGKDHFQCSNGCCIKKEFECDEQPHCSDRSDEENCQKLNESLTRLLKIEVNEKAHCTDPPVTGPCRASFKRWYYDPLNKKCHHFIYGGCDGNNNNFETTDNCMTNCSGVTENDVFARGLFLRLEDEIGESQSASVALAVVLVVAILAGLAVLGYFYLKNRRKNNQHEPVATSSPQVGYSDDDQQIVYNSTTAKA